MRGDEPPQRRGAAEPAATPGRFVPAPAERGLVLVEVSRRCGPRVPATPDSAVHRPHPADRQSPSGALRPAPGPPVLRLRTTRGRWRPAAHLRRTRGRGGAERPERGAGNSRSTGISRDIPRGRRMAWWWMRPSSNATMPPNAAGPVPSVPLAIQQCFWTARVVLRQPSGLDPIELEETRDEALEQTALVQLVAVDRVGHHSACPSARAQGRRLPLLRGRVASNDAKSVRSSAPSASAPQLACPARAPASRENDAAEAVEFDVATASTGSARRDRLGLNPRRWGCSWRPRTGAWGQRWRRVRARPPPRRGPTAALPARP